MVDIKRCGPSDWEWLIAEVERLRGVEKLYVDGPSRAELDIVELRYENSRYRTVLEEIEKYIHNLPEPEYNEVLFHIQDIVRATIALEGVGDE